MKYAIILGSNIYVGTTGVLSYESNGNNIDFFRIRETFREKSKGSYLSADIDIKDIDGKHEIALYKSQPVIVNEGITVKHNKKNTLVTRKDGSIVIRIEQIDLQKINIQFENNLDALIHVTGEFMVDNIKVVATYDALTVEGRTTAYTKHVVTGGLVLRKNGITSG